LETVLTAAEAKRQQPTENYTQGKIKQF